MREIGKRLRVSRTAAYAHFKDKGALLAAIGDAGFIELGKVLEAAKTGATGFAAQMDAMSVAYFRFAQEHPAHFEVMFNVLLEAGGGAAAESGRGFTLLGQGPPRITLKWGYQAFDSSKLKMWFPVA